MVCSYRKTLSYNEQISDEEEKSRLLKACHQRCADRTLKVLEKNGSIFIKLGQHLVGFPLGFMTGKHADILFRRVL